MLKKPYKLLPLLIAAALLCTTAKAQVALTFHIAEHHASWTELGNLCNVRNTAVALSSWGTSVSYDNLSILSEQGEVLYRTDFSNANDYLLDWNANGGNWDIEGGTLNQTSTSMYGQCNVCYNLTGENCTIELDARKNSGSEGFLIAFSYNDPNNYVWWNLGGWNNTQHAIEQCMDGVKTTLCTKAGSIATGTDYHLRIVKSDEEVYCYVDNQLYHKVALADTRRVDVDATLSQTEEELVVTLANSTSQQQDVAIKAGNFRFGSKAALQVQRKGGAATSSSLTISDSQLFGYTLPAEATVVMTIPVTHIEDETGIQAISATNVLNKQNKAFGLDGRQHAVGSHLRPGLYIINGKKVILNPQR